MNKYAHLLISLSLGNVFADYSFQKLQQYADNTEVPIFYYFFDLLFLDKKGCAEFTFASA